MAKLTMTKRQADKIFLHEIRPDIIRHHGLDRPMIREAWNNWTDGLCKNGQITQRQYDRWLYRRD